MISLKKTPEADGSMDSTAVPDSDSPYGYGTCISLSDEQVKALGLSNVKIGAKVKITAFGIVESLRAEIDGKEEGEDAKMVYASIQLTDMEASPVSSVNMQAMYPSAAGA